MSEGGALVQLEAQGAMNQYLDTNGVGVNDPGFGRQQRLRQALYQYPQHIARDCERYADQKCRLRSTSEAAYEVCMASARKRCETGAAPWKQ